MINLKIYFYGYQRLVARNSSALNAKIPVHSMFLMS